MWVVELCGKQGRGWRGSKGGRLEKERTTREEEWEEKAVRKTRKWKLSGRLK